MNISRIVTKTKKLVSDNSPLILTAVGVAGTVTTAYLAAKASFRGAEVLLEYETDRERRAILASEKAGSPDPVILVPLTKREKFDLLWKLYIPAVSTGVVTCSSIVFANRITTKRAAALATAYSLSERAYAEYRDKVVEKLGKEDEAEIRKEVARKRIDAAPPGEIFINEADGVLCHDAYSGRFFRSSKNAIEAARNELNYNILKSDYVTLSDFYDKIGLPHTSVSDEMGWNSENQLEIGWSAVETPDGRPCLSYDFAVVPIRDPWRFR